MAQSGQAGRTVPTGSRASRWAGRLRLLAVVLALVGIGNLIAWGNRWYVTEMLVRSAGPDESWEWFYGLLHSAHEALVRGVALLALAGLIAALAVWLRRRLSPEQRGSTAVGPAHPTTAGRTPS